jgi:hypothetical protein
MTSPGRALNAEEVEAWILDVASSDLYDVERSEVTEYVASELDQRPREAWLWYMAGCARYHLWRQPRPPEVTLAALESLARAIILEPQYVFARLKTI